MNMTDMRRKDVERRQRGFASMDPQRQREIAQVEHLMELARVYAHAYYNHYTGSVDGMLDKSKATLKAALEAMADAAYRARSAVPCGVKTDGGKHE